ncbi:DUF2637 domain-containing protein [Catellatospora coxensis]|uniref:DUF2637 domain-containing protein n=1 Tax=Catellatospora coxensis TaxID=310354 RepID=A0A8J3KMC9_9ACTN|nr:DUF2637 domain-containing protein [Catellatospora coxensis]GIG03650.1 hypothetical protein Cco03nite_03500 [Catellatospora coxensis]
MTDPTPADHTRRQSGRPRGERIEGIVQTVIMLAIGAAAGAASFRHVHDVAASHGQTGWLAWADAVTLEAASIAAGLEMRRRKRHGKPVLFPAATLTCAVALSLAAQVVEAEDSVIGWIAAALPALGFLAMVKMAMGRADPTTPPSLVGAVHQPPGPVEAEPGPTPAEPGPDQPEPGPVPDGADQSATVADHAVQALLPAARTAANTITTAGVSLTRTTLARQLRRDGHHLSNQTATALVRALRAHDTHAPDQDADEEPPMNTPTTAAARPRPTTHTPPGET